MGLEQCWVTAGSNSILWGKASTYKQIPASRLPLIDRSLHGGKFEWLTLENPYAPMEYGLNEDDEPDPEAAPSALRSLEQQTSALRLSLPDAFRAFFSQPELFSRIPSCTACYFELAARPVQVEGLAGHAIRFMNDQQCCYVWLLHIDPDGRHSVVAASVEIDEEATGTTLEECAAFQEPLVVSQDFEEFLHRFWLENCLWFAHREKQALTQEQAAYVVAAERSGV